MFQINFIIYFVIFNFFLTTEANRCCKISGKLLNYHLIRRNSRSTESILSQRKFSSVDECQEYARSKNALAFNFYTKKIDNLIFNSQILGCPENSLSALVNETGVKYYSLYSGKILSGIIFFFFFNF